MTLIICKRCGQRVQASNQRHIDLCSLAHSIGYEAGKKAGFLEGRKIAYEEMKGCLGAYEDD